MNRVALGLLRINQYLDYLKNCGQGRTCEGYVMEKLRVVFGRAGRVVLGLTRDVSRVERGEGVDITWVWEG